MRVLVVDDDKSVAHLIRRVLSEDGYAIDVAYTGEDARLLSFVNQYDGIVLDLELGDRHGFEILQELRSSGRTAPVLLYTGTEDPEAIVRGLDAGADMYVVKPITNQELRARVRSLIRRGPGSRLTEQLIVGHTRLNRLTRRVTTPTGEIDLTPMELRLLEHMMLRAGDVISKTELTERLYDQDYERDSNVIEVFIGRLRRKLDPDETLRPIETLRGRGYRFSIARSAGS